MISAVVLVPGGPPQDVAHEGELLVRSLVWLVSGVVSGIIRDVTLAGPEGLGIADIADHSGCAAVEDVDEARRVTQAVGTCREPRILILRSGFEPSSNMLGELDGFMRAKGQRDVVRLLAAPANFLERLFPALAQTVGVLAPASTCRALGTRDFRALVSALKPRRSFATRASSIF